MRYLLRGLALATVLLLLGTSVASAQKPQTRKGFWIGFGFGWGSYGISCDACTGLGRESFYKSFAPGAKPRYDTVLKVLQSLGVKLNVTA